MAYSQKEIESLIGWHGEPNKAVEALKKIGFLKEAKKGLICKNWRQHQGHLISFSRRAKRANKLRWDRVRKESLKDHRRNPPSVPTVPSVPNQPKQISASKPREPLPHQVFTDWYLAAVEDIRPEKFPDDTAYKAAVKAGYARFGRPIKQILAFAAGDVEKAKSGTQAIGLWLQGSNLSWGAETVAKWFNDWARNPKEFGKNGKY